jgi:fibronectin type 3 domain-containing protein
MIGTATNNSYIDTAITVGTYHYKVKSVNDNGESDLSSNYASVTVSAFAPANVSASVEGTQVTVSWDAVSGASSYQIYRSASSSGYYSEIGQATASPYIDSGLSLGTYYYGVKAVSQIGTSSITMSSPIAINGPPPPSTVSTSLSATGTVTVSWDAVSGASSYRIYRSTSSSGYYSEIGQATASPYLDSGLSPGTYYYKISSVNYIGEGSLSSAAAVSLAPPSRPGNVSARLEDAHVTVSWEAVSGATSYKVYRSTDPSGTYNLKATIEGTSYQDDTAGLVLDTTYYYQVRAVNRFGESDPSSAASISLTLPPSPNSLSVTVLSDTSVRITWQAVSSANAYRVYQASNASGTYTPLETITTVTYRVTGLSPNTTYYFKVASIDSLGEGSPSPAEPARTASTMTPLTVSQWHNDSLEVGSVKLYYFEVSSGKSYVLSWNDRTQDSTKTATITVKAFYQETEAAITLNQHNFTASSTGRVIIQVTASSAGTYNVAYGEN